jgi:hypothetical protein
MRCATCTDRLDADAPDAPREVVPTGDGFVCGDCASDYPTAAEH